MILAKVIIMFLASYLDGFLLSSRILPEIPPAEIGPLY